MPLYCSREETLSCGKIPVSAQEEIYRESVLIDSTIKIRPSLSNSDVCLVHAP